MFSIPLSDVPLSFPFSAKIIDTSDHFYYSVYYSADTVVIGVFVESLFVSLLIEKAKFRFVEKVRYFGNQAVLVQLDTSALILRNGRIESRFQGTHVFVDDFCNSGFPAYLCIADEKATEYSLLTADHSVLVHSFLHIHSQKREKPKETPQSLQTSESQSKISETGRSSFFFGLRNRMQGMEKELKRIRSQEDVLLSIERGKKQSTHWNRLVAGKTSIRLSTEEISAIQVRVERIQSWLIGGSIKVELEGLWKEPSSDVFFWCYSLNQNSVVCSRRKQLKDGRFLAVFFMKGVKMISPTQLFYLFVSCGGINRFVGEFDLTPKPQDSSEFALIYNDRCENAKVIRYLNQIPGVRVSFVNSSLKCAHIPTDLETVRLIEQTVHLMDPHSTVLLDRLPLQTTRELIESVCECLLNELRLLKEERFVLNCDLER